jgi:hypothetical protein
MASLIQVAIDEEELIKQYNHICQVIEGHREHKKWMEENDMGRYVNDVEPLVGIQNLLEGLMIGLWGDTLIYRGEREVESNYMVFLPGRQRVYLMSPDADSSDGMCSLFRDDGEGAIPFTQLDNGDFVPIGYEEEVSIISVPVGVRQKVLELISDDLEYYEDHLVVT